MSLRIKICGTTSAADAQLAIDCGADMLGFIFYPKSPRHITPAAAAAIIKDLPDGITPVGVFVNESAETMRAVAEQAGLRALQLHGDEAPQLLAELRDYELIKVISLKSAGDLAKMDLYPDALILVDTPCPQWGGSGQTGDWDLARTAAARRPIILAGGLNPENVGEAVATVRPAGVDVVSGVEAEKGLKDPAKVNRFIGAARAAAAARCDA